VKKLQLAHHYVILTALATAVVLFSAVLGIAYWLQGTVSPLVLCFALYVNISAPVLSSIAGPKSFRTRVVVYLVTLGIVYTLVDQFYGTIVVALHF
jgi:hypothetical protein